MTVPFEKVVHFWDKHKQPQNSPYTHTLCGKLTTKVSKVRNIRLIKRSDTESHLICEDCAKDRPDIQLYILAKTEL